MLRTVAILFSFLTALLLCDARTQSAPEVFSDSARATIASGIFQRYEEALNRHDADAVAAFWALDTEGSVQRARTKAVLARWKGYREFEAATHAVFDLSWKSLGADAFEVTQREECDFYRELGTGTKTSTFVVHIRDGRFHDVQRGTSSDSLLPYDQTLTEFKDWILKKQPDRAAEVFRDGDFVFDKNTAGPLMELVRDWRADIHR